MTELTWAKVKRTRSGIHTCLLKTEQAHNKSHPGGRRADPNWAVWYARYLLDSANLSQFASRQWSEDELAEALTHLDSAYFNGSQNQPWSAYAAARLSS